MDTDPSDRRPYALVVDDEIMIRMHAVAILEDAGFRTFEAVSVARALDVLHEHHASIMLMFTDVELVGPENGFALARETSQNWPHIGILVASGRRHPGPGEMPNGALFVAKPFSADVVHDRVKQLLPENQKPEPLKD